MSVQALSWVLEHSESRLGARCVITAIANHCKADGTGAWPAMRTIAHEARVSVREAQYAIAELRQIGELGVERGAGPSGVNVYCLPKMIGAKFAPGGGAQEASKGCKGPPEVVHKGSPEPSKTEPSTTEPSKTFCAFWDLYPRKVGRAKAEKLWQGMGEAERALAIRGLLLWKQAEQWNRDDGKYIPHGSTFLQQKRYLDEPWTGAFEEVA